MKPALLIATALGLLALASATAQAWPRGGGVFVTVGGYGCPPRFSAPPICFAPPICYAPQAYVCAPRVVCYRPSLGYYDSAPVIYAPPVSGYRAPIVPAGLTVGNVTFGWRR